ncbi:unnamed protein product [Dicrocoelium dendriticum]|nr:unnamed protein product [Dicrocoelium dendriticum]
MQMFHVMGDQESAIRTEFMQSFLAKNMKEYGLIKQPTRCCGCAYYSQRIGPEYTLIVLDGYEILSVDLKENTRYAPGGITISAPNQDSTSQKCFQCRVKCGEDNLVGWATELRQENGCLDREDFKLLPRLRCAISEHQLQWLNLQLQEAVRKTDNVVVACHIPLHPLLVSDRSALPVNWKELLYLIMNFNCVRLVLSGRPLGEAAQPPNPQKPYHYDHGIVYYSVPPALELTKQDKLAWTHMIVELGYDFVRIKGEGIPLPQETPNGDPCSEPSWTIPFEPRRKLRVNHFDYAFNGGYDF